MFCALCVEPCPVDCIFMGASHDLSCYSRDGCLVDFARLPVDVAWGRASLNPTAVAASKVVDRAGARRTESIGSRLKVGPQRVAGPNEQPAPLVFARSGRQLARARAITDEQRLPELAAGGADRAVGTRDRTGFGVTSRPASGAAKECASMTCAYRPAKLFTVEQANAVLPLVAPLRPIWSPVA